MGGTRSKLTPQDKQEIVSLYTQGHAVRPLMAKFHTSEETIKKVVIVAGDKVRQTRRLTSQDKQGIASLYAQGCTLKEIRITYRTSEGAIKKAVEAAGGQIRRYTPTDALDRFWENVQKTDTCWLWTGNADTRGYGIFSIGYKKIRAHRFSWALFYGKPPASTLFVCHHCDNPPCVNPEHLFEGTQQDNIDDCISKDRNCRGERVPWSVLTDVQVLEIRRRYAAGETQSDLGRALNVARLSIHKVVHRQQWTHI